jgi:DNA-binding MarR family transcriptional regulator
VAKVSRLSPTEQAEKGAKKRGPQRVLDGSAAGGATELDALIHERVRLGILCALAVCDALTFNDLLAQLGTTGGNLSVHARKLEEAGLLACKKGFEGRVPRTEFKITARGRRALEKYLAHMEALVGAMKKR